jgi:hypothetical protein
MQHVQGYLGSHWTLPLGNYSLCIAPAATMATINTMRMQNVPSLIAVLMAIAMRWYYTAVIGHGIGGIVIPAKMARLAKARRWSKRWQTCLSSPDLTAIQICDGARIQVR